MRALALAGPRASKQSIQSFFDPQVNFTALWSATSKEIVGAIRDNPPDIVLVFGGDGTVNRHLGQLANTGIPVLVVPCGSGNDLARVAGTDRVNLALRTWNKFIERECTTRDIDLGRITSPALKEFRFFSCCANIGLDADAARRADQMPDWLKSHGGYFLGGLMALAAYQPQMLDVQSLQRSHSGKAWFVSVSNTPTFGGGLKIAPQADVSDGLLNVTFVSGAAFSRSQLARHFPKILSGRHVGLDGLEIFKTGALDIETPSPQPVYADGEYITETPCRIEVARGALRLITNGCCNIEK